MFQTFGKVMAIMIIIALVITIIGTIVLAGLVLYVIIYI